MNKDLTQALSSLATFGMEQAVGNAVNEQRDREVKERAYTLLSSNLPTIATINNVDSAQMATLNNLGSSTEIVANIDVFSNKINKEAQGKGKLNPDMYNAQLAEQVAPYLQVIDGMSGADKTLAYQRLIDGVADAQGTYLKNNQMFKTNEVKQLAHANIAALVQSAVNKPEELQQGTYEEGLNTLMSTWSEKGLTAQDTIALYEEVVTGLISKGDVKATELLTNSDSIRMLDRNTLAKAIQTGQKRIDERILIEKAPGLFTDAEQRDIIIKDFTDWVKKNPDKDTSDYLLQKASWLMKFSNNVITSQIVGSASDYMMSGDPVHNEQVKPKRDKFVKIFAPLVKSKGATAVIEKLTPGEASKMAPVIRSLERGTNPWDAMAIFEIDAKLSSAGIDNAPEVRNDALDRIGTHLAEMQESTFAFGDIFGINLATASPDIQNAYLQKNRISAKLNDYMLRNKNVDLTNDAWIEAFVADSFVRDPIGDSTMLVAKGSPTFSNGDSKRESQEIVNQLGYNFIADGVTKSYDSTFDNMDFRANNKVKIERSIDNSKIYISLQRDPGVFSDWEDYKVNSMFRIDYDNNGQPIFDILDMEEGKAALSNPTKFNEYAAQGYIPTTNGKFPIDLKTYETFKKWYNLDSSAERRRYQAATRTTPRSKEEQALVQAGAILY